MKPNPFQNANLAGAFLTRRKLVFGRSLLGFFLCVHRWYSSHQAKHDGGTADLRRVRSDSGWGEVTPRATERFHSSI